MNHANRRLWRMSIEDVLRAVLEHDYGGVQRHMARDWGIEPEVLHRWLTGKVVPSAVHYPLLVQKLNRSMEEVHRLCQEARDRRKLKVVAVTARRYAGKPSAPITSSHQRAKRVLAKV